MDKGWLELRSQRAQAFHSSQPSAVEPLAGAGGCRVEVFAAIVGQRQRFALSGLCRAQGFVESFVPHSGTSRWAG